MVILFEKELSKSINASKRRRERFFAKRYLEQFDPTYHPHRLDINISSLPEDYKTYDNIFEKVYSTKYIKDIT